MSEKAETKPRISKLTRMLALAHHIESLVESGELESSADAARALGITRARMTQVMNLLLLSPQIQARITCDAIATTEHHLRSVVKEADWKTQSELLHAGEARNPDRTAMPPKNESPT